LFLSGWFRKKERVEEEKGREDEREKGVSDM
jgi:hypothetical protein